MKTPLSWLKEFVEIDCDTKTLGDKLTMSGSKVEVIEYLGAELKNVVTGKIEKIEKHPDADKLVVCQINVGKEVLQIVTGAKNVFEGAVVPVALVGAELANDLKIKAGKLRGVESNGMLCSVEELGYSRAEYPEAPEDGIYIFDSSVEIGQDVIELLKLRDDVIEFEITSNRSDCFSMYGIAREIAATLDKPLAKINPCVKNKVNFTSNLQVELPSDNCNRYKGAIVTDVKVFDSPLWLRQKLFASGIRPINNFVDITNYVMLELGQPMHAFDLDKIEGDKIIVREAVEGEKILCLDDVERTLDAKTTVIADSEKALAIAGIIGGNDSKITSETKNVIFESANFCGVNTRLTSKRLGVRTDSSGKFEKGLDPELVSKAIDRALELVELLGCGTVTTFEVDNYKNSRPQATVDFTVEGINKLVGVDFTKEQIEAYLNRVEIKVEGNKAISPTFRTDIKLEADLAEEVARLYGYDKIEPKLTLTMNTVGKKNVNQTIQNIVENVLFTQGVSEALTYSFEGKQVFDKLNVKEDDKLRKTISVLNPLGETFSEMRTTMANGLLNVLSLNYNKNNAQCSVFEIANIYLADVLPITELPTEQKTLSVAMYGGKDFFDLKGIIEAIFEKLQLTNVSYVKESEISYMHPGRCAKVFVNNELVGYFGDVHPLVLKNYEIGVSALFAELNFDKIVELAKLSRKFEELPKYPASKRDIAMLVKEDVSVAEIEQAIREKAGKNLEDLQLFDIYRGAQIKEGHKSVAFNLTFRGKDRTLTEEEISSPYNKVIKNLEEKLGAELRK